MCPGIPGRSGLTFPLPSRGDKTVMSGQQLFVLVSTGQNVANLPPVLERANPGDLVLWVESAFAREKKWAAGARRVLAEHKLEVLPGGIEGQDINAPDEVANACRPAVE